MKYREYKIVKFSINKQDTTEQMNILGREGWEAYAEHYSYGRTIYFKREIIQ